MVNLEALKKVVEVSEDLHEHDFDASWYYNGRQNTYCLAGWAATYGWFHYRGFKLVQGSDYFKYISFAGKDSYQAVQNFFGLSEEEALDLFGCKFETKQETVANLEKFIAEEEAKMQDRKMNATSNSGIQIDTIELEFQVKSIKLFMNPIEYQKFLNQYSNNVYKLQVTPIETGYVITTKQGYGVDPLKGYLERAVGEEFRARASEGLNKAVQSSNFSN